MGHKALLFDMDGVISDSQWLMAATEQEICRRNKLSVPESEWQHFKGKSSRYIFARILEKYGNGHRCNAVELSRQKHDLYIERACQQLTPITGAVEFVKFARTRYGALGLTTSNHRSCADVTLKSFKLQGYFDTVVVQEDIPEGMHKPHPEPYKVTAERLGVPTDRCCVIEDTANGIMSGVLAGCTVIGITTSYERKVLKAAGAHYVVSSFMDLASLL